MDAFPSNQERNDQEIKRDPSTEADLGLDENTKTSVLEANGEVFDSDELRALGW